VRPGTLSPNRGKLEDIVTTSAARMNARRSTLDRMVEGAWLICLALLPLMIAHENWIAGMIQVPKVFLLRSVALLLAVLLTFEWASAGSRAGSSGMPLVVGELPGRLWRHLRTHLILASTLVLLAANLLSAVLSPVPWVSLGGVDLGWDSYGLYSVFSYLLIFGTVATHLRTMTQVRRALWALVATSILASLYGVAQHFGVDPFQVDPEPLARVHLTMGNPIFAAAYLIMTIPISLALWQTWAPRMTLMRHIAIGAVLLAIPLTALTFTLSRGSLISITIGFISYFALMAWLLGRRSLIPPAASLALALVFATGMNFVPVERVDGAGLANRLGTIPSEFVPGGGGLATRQTMWEVATEAFLTTPWADTDRFPELPGLSVQPLRPLIGYGPDVFGYAYNFVGNSELAAPPAHAHNFLIHTLVELGIFGAAAYLWLFGLITLTLVRLLQAAKRGEVSLELTLLLIGSATILVARSVEQMAGKAQVIDLTVIWVLLGMIVALRGIAERTPAEEPATAAAAPNANRRRRRPAGRATAAGGGNAASVRMGVAFVVMLGGFAVWWLAVVPPVDAAILGGRGLAAGIRGDMIAGGDFLERSVAAEPNGFSPRFFYSAAWLNGAKRATDTDQQMLMLRTAYDIIGEVFKRDPLNGRARIAAGEMSRYMGISDTDLADRAVHDYEAVVELLPGLWEQHEQLAWTLTTLGDYERALEVVEDAKERAGRDNAAAYFLLFVEAKALQGLGRTDEIAPIIALLEDSSIREAAALLGELRNSLAP
jgi:O-antigen ligase